MADGRTFERALITAWFRDNSTSPMTGAQLRHKELTVNHAVRGMVLRFLDDCEAEAAQTRAT